MGVRRSRRWVLAAAAAAALIGAGCGAPAAPPAGDPLVVTTAGPVRGTEAGGHRVFQGIPFAAPPVAGARWQPPQPVEPWTQPRDATAPGPMCVQSPRDPMPGPQSEDCLHLNVTVPATAGPDRPVPVMVWLHGGGFYQGNAAEYDARRLAEAGDVMVVTANYRLGILGFLRLPEMRDSGAFGLQDQQAVLRWVRDNAPAFGGDPGNVTLFGESAGSMSTCAQLTSPGAAGLFRKAVLQSGTCMIEMPPFQADGTGYTPYEPPSHAEAVGVAAARDLGCAVPAEVVACMRGKSTAELTERMDGFSPSFGNSVLPEHPEAALRAGRFHQVPVMVGSTRDEARSSIAALMPSPLPADDYRTLLVEDFGAAAESVAAAYPPVDGDNRLTYAQVHTDRTWAYPTRLALDVFAAKVPAYAFEFADPAAPRYPGMADAGYPYGAFHGSDVSYLFDVGGVEAAFTDDQRRLATDMIGYWSRFARTGDPNGAGAPHWPAYAPAGHVQSLTPGPGRVAVAAYGPDHRLEFWTRVLGG